MQHRTGRRRPRTRFARAYGAAAAAVVLTATMLAPYGAGGLSSSASTLVTSARRSGGVVTDANVAEPPNYIMPIETANANTGSNVEVSSLLWKGLYSFAPIQPVLDYSLSIGNKPVFSDGGKVVTITMKHYQWSDGKPVSARDVQFGMNIIRAEGALWSGYEVGGFPYNVTSFKVLGTYKFQMDLTRKFSPTWFADDQLTDLIPLPQHAWDKTSVNGPIGNDDLTPAGAKKVYNFLNKQSQIARTFATNPLWKVVDGAWKLSTFGGASSPTIFVPNQSYSGHHAIISKFEMTPFTSGTAEYDAMRSGPSSLTIGGLPTQDVPQIKTLEREGYAALQTHGWAVDYVVINFTNPKLGKLFDQLYLRQALQRLIDQKTDVKAFQDGMGSPQYGPTPSYPPNNTFLSSHERTNPYPYSVSAAETLLKDHGWTIHRGGTDVCKAGGAGSGHCGAGVPTGEKLSIPFVVASGDNTLQNETRLFQSDARKAGINLGLRYEPFNTSIAIMNPCTKKNLSSPTCKWGIGIYGGDGEFVFPDPSKFFVPGGSDNTGGYNNPSLTKMISEIHYAPNSMALYKRVANFGATQLPMLWFPDTPGTGIVMVDKHLHVLRGTTPFNAEFGNFTPEDWYFTKS